MGDLCPNREGKFQGKAEKAWVHTACVPRRALGYYQLGTILVKGTLLIITRMFSDLVKYVICRKFWKATSSYFIFSEKHPKLQRNLSFLFLSLATCFTQLKKFELLMENILKKGLRLRFIVLFNMKTIQKFWNDKTICPRIARRRRIKEKLYYSLNCIIAWLYFPPFSCYPHHKRNVKKNLVYLAILPCQCSNKKSNHEKKILKPFRRNVYSIKFPHSQQIEALYS